MDVQLLLLYLPLFLAFIGWEMLLPAKTRRRLSTAGYQWKIFRQRHPGADASGWRRPWRPSPSPTSDTLWGWRLFDIVSTSGASCRCSCCRSLLLAVPPREPPRALALGLPRGAPQLGAAQPLHRLSWSLMYPVSGMWLFWIPMILIGFLPEAVVATVLVSLGFPSSSSIPRWWASSAN